MSQCRIQYDLVSQDGGYRASCTCGQWAYSGVVRNPWSWREHEEVQAAHNEHTGFIEPVEES